MEHKTIGLIPDDSGLGWKIYKGSVHISHTLESSPNPFRQIGTLILSNACFQVNTGEQLSEAERKALLKAIKKKQVFKDVSIDV